MLNDALSRPAPGSLSPDTRGRLRELVTTLRNSLKKLRQPTETGWTRGPIDERQPVNGTDAVKMRALLQLPDWSTPERLHLWNNYRKVVGWAEKGEEVTISRRGKVVTRLLPPRPSAQKVDWAKSAAVRMDRNGFRVLTAKESAELLAENSGKW